MSINARNRETRDVAKDIEYASAIRGIDIHKLWAWVRTVKDRDLGNKISNLNARLLGLASNKHDCGASEGEKKGVVAREFRPQIGPIGGTHVLAVADVPRHDVSRHTSLSGNLRFSVQLKEIFRRLVWVIARDEAREYSFGPVASSKYGISASIPPSHGSKLGMLKSGPDLSPKGLDEYREWRDVLFAQLLSLSGASRGIGEQLGPVGKPLSRHRTLCCDSLGILKAAPRLDRE